MIKRIAQMAGFAGLLAAILLTLLQSLWVTPLILQAESYESAAPAEQVVAEHGHAVAEPAHEHAQAQAAGHSHDGQAWAPQDGWQRTLATGLSNLVVAVGFALMLAGLFTLRAPGRTWQGLLWGLGGFATFSLAPSAGLPPELPGTAAADLLLRQYWWIGTAVATAAGLGLLAFGRHWALRIAGLVLLALPHLIGAPHPEVHESLAPAELQEEFILASLLTNALFWAALGLAAAWFHGRDARQDA
jgi:cobalt transporter subunit CbtA